MDRFIDGLMTPGMNVVDASGYRGRSMSGVSREMFVGAAIGAKHGHSGGAAG
ncbi:hypothetical protein BSFP_062360 [Burkholderia stabilis]|uniref:Uncharacterized protein n=1 Tax=Burkholderia stabilis TaxID=95485 RepID=A0A1Y1BTS4_9BURK|nr:hypothetical protein BSFP_062360 [Burkholderia stabilis]